MDFCGVTLNGVHLDDELNIKLVSNGSRFAKNLLPTISPRTARVVGQSGSYYFGRDYTQFPITLSLATDGIYEEDILRFQKLLDSEAPIPLIFDEMPFKKYMVTLAAPPIFNFICFEERGYYRVYKGEISLSLISYSPYAVGIAKSLEELNTVNPKAMENVVEWNIGNGGSSLYLPLNTPQISSNSITIKNYGVAPLDWKMRVNITSSNSTVACGTTTVVKNLPTGIYLIDSKIEIITTTNNTLVTQIGEFNPVKLPAGESKTFTVTGGTLSEIEYNFLYY